MSISTAIDRDQVKTTASGNWGEIIESLTGISHSRLTAKSSPCPLQCNGGDDRYSPFDDFNETGGVVCRHCGTNPDGFATIMKATGWGFAETLQRVAEHLGIERQERPATSAKTKGRKQKKKKTVHKTPVKAVAALAHSLKVKNRIAEIREPDSQYLYFRSRPTKAEDASIVVLRWDRTLEEGGPGKEIRQMSKLSDGWVNEIKADKRPLFGLFPNTTHDLDLTDVADAEIVYITEGEKCCLAMLGIGVNAVSPSQGSSCPQKTDWSILDGKSVVICLDHDEPGRKFGKAVAGLLTEQAPAAKVSVCDFSTDEGWDMGAGQDVYDWIQFHRSRSDSCTDEHLRTRLAGLTKQPDNSFPLINGYRGDGEVTPLSLQKITNRLDQSTNGWPKMCGSLFHYDEGADRIRALNKASELFAWAGAILDDPPNWINSGSCHSKEEFFSHLKDSQERFDAIERLPHQPPVSDIYYGHRRLPESTGSHLQWLLSRFSVATEDDRSLIAALLLTLFWGGPAGERPIFLVTADGHGAGKSTLAKIVAEICGGSIDVDPKEKPKELKERFLSPDGRTKMLVLCDNLKGFRVSNAELEAIVTASRISGREMYVGESSRPNLVTWLMTSNSPGMSRDLAQRTVNIQLKRSEYSASWASDTISYVREHHWEIIADIIAMLRESRGVLQSYSRWAAWESGILSKLPNANDLQGLIVERQKALDCDDQESEDIDDYFAAQLRSLGYDPNDSIVFLPGQTVASWYASATGERCSTTKATRSIGRNITDGLTKRLIRHRTSQQRGFAWVGPESDGNLAAMDFDIEARIERGHRW